MIILDYKDRRPIYEQVTEKLQELILCGVLEPKEQLPSVRSLAMELSINPNTIQRAYAELERLGLIHTIKGKGSFVSKNTEIKHTRETQLIRKVEELIREARRIGIPQQDLSKVIQDVYQMNGGEKHD